MKELIEYERESKNVCPKNPDEIFYMSDALHWALRFIHRNDCALDLTEKEWDMIRKSAEILKLAGFAAFIKNDAPVDYSVEHRSGEFKSLAEIFHRNGNVVDVKDGKRIQRHDESADGKIFRRDVAAGPQEVINAVKEI